MFKFTSTLCNVYYIRTICAMYTSVFIGLCDKTFSSWIELIIKTLYLIKTLLLTFKGIVFIY